MKKKETPLSRRLLAMREARGWNRPDAIRELVTIHASAGLLPPELTTQQLREFERGIVPSFGALKELSTLYGVAYKDLALTGLPGGAR